MNTQTALQTEPAPTWRPLSGGEILLLPYFANLTQLQSGALARCNTADPVGAVIYIEAVSFDAEAEGRILFRYVNNNNGDMGALWLAKSRATMTPDRRGNLKPLWSIDKASLEVVSL